MDTTNEKSLAPVDAARVTTLANLKLPEEVKALIQFRPNMRDTSRIDPTKPFLYIDPVILKNQLEANSDNSFIPMNKIKLVQSSTNEFKSRTKPDWLKLGLYYFAEDQLVWEEMPIVILATSVITYSKSKFKEGENTSQLVVFVLQSFIERYQEILDMVVNFDDDNLRYELLSNIFCYEFQGTSQQVWKRLSGHLQKFPEPWSRVVKLGSEEVQNENNSWQSPTYAIDRPLIQEENMFARSLHMFASEYLRKSQEYWDNLKHKNKPATVEEYDRKDLDGVPAPEGVD